MIIVALGTNNILYIVRKIKMMGRETNIEYKIDNEILIWLNILLHKIKLKNPKLLLEGVDPGGVQSK
jgi:hypothetical protein